MSAPVRLVSLVLAVCSSAPWATDAGLDDDEAVLLQLGAAVRSEPRGSPEVMLTLGEGLTSVPEQPALSSSESGAQVLDQSSLPSCVALRNMGSYSLVDVAVGTPEQVFSIVADTGSDNVIVPSCVCQEMRRCAAEDRCFTGTNTSSTFSIDDGPMGPPVLVLSFGSGPIQVAVSSDVVRVGHVQTTMDDGVYLMVDQALDFGGSFEGILGLGLPFSLRSTMLDKDLEEEEEEEDVEWEDMDAVGDIIQDIFGMPETALRAKKIGSHAGAPSDASVADEEDASGLVAIVHPQGSNTSMGSERNSTDPDELAEKPGFLERAGVSRFSMCFNDGTDGALRLNPPPAALTLGNIGREHWAVDFRGLSVGGNSTALGFCGGDDMQAGQETPCGGIPDSGTTAIMAPPEHIDMLFESLCDGWERCRQNHTAMVEAATGARDLAEKEYGFDPFGIQPASKSEIFQFLIFDCDSWLESDDDLNELPSVNFNLRDPSGTEQVLEMPGWSYVIETQLDDYESFLSHRREKIPMFSGAAAGDAPTNDSASDGAGPGTFRICEPAFSGMDYVTKLNGPIWILGTPFFYMFEVGYDLNSSQPGISFTSLTESGCGTCATDGTAALLSGSRGVAGAPVAERRHRRLKRGGEKRGPSVDTGRPL